MDRSQQGRESPNFHFGTISNKHGMFEQKSTIADVSGSDMKLFGQPHSKKHTYRSAAAQAQLVELRTQGIRETKFLQKVREDALLRRGRSRGEQHLTLGVIDNEKSYNNNRKQSSRIRKVRQISSARTIEVKEEKEIT